jgi:hypothetical protein
MATTLPTEFYGMSMSVTVTVAPENVEKFLALFKPAYEAVSAEPECTAFEVHYDPQNPGVFHWVEGWSKDVAWLMAVYFTPTHPAQPRRFTIKRFEADMRGCNRVGSVKEGVL